QAWRPECFGVYHGSCLRVRGKETPDDGEFQAGLVGRLAAFRPDASKDASRNRPGMLELRGAVPGGRERSLLCDGKRRLVPGSGLMGEAMLQRVDHALGSRTFQNARVFRCARTSDA